MAAPERFAEMSDFSLALRASSIHGTSLHLRRRNKDGRYRSHSGHRTVLALNCQAAFDPSATWVTQYWPRFRRLAVLLSHGHTAPLGGYTDVQLRYSASASILTGSVGEILPARSRAATSPARIGLEK